MLTVDLNTWVLFAVAVMNAMTLFYTRKTEKNTNSLVSNLLDKTAQASDAAGATRARKEGELTAALKAAQPAAVAVPVYAPQQQPQQFQPPQPTAQPSQGPSSKAAPLPVADDRTAKAAEKTATAAQQTADATKQMAVDGGRVADAAEETAKKTPG